MKLHVARAQASAYALFVGSVEALCGTATADLQPDDARIHSEDWGHVVCRTCKRLHKALTPTGDADDEGGEGL